MVYTSAFYVAFEWLISGNFCLSLRLVLGNSMLPKHSQSVFKRVWTASGLVLTDIVSEPQLCKFSEKVWAIEER